MVLAHGAIFPKWLRWRSPQLRGLTLSCCIRRRQRRFGLGLKRPQSWLAVLRVGSCSTLIARCARTLGTRYSTSPSSGSALGRRPIRNSRPKGHERLLRRVTVARWLSPSRLDEPRRTGPRSLSCSRHRRPISQTRALSRRWLSLRTWARALVQSLMLARPTTRTPPEVEPRQLRCLVSL